MKIRLLAVGTRQPDWVNQAYAQYAQRLPREMPMQLQELPAARNRGSTADALREEGSRLLTKIDQTDWCVVLTERGRALDTPALAKRLEDWRQSGRNVALLIGGADGLHGDVYERADEQIALSQLTFPHGMVRVIIAEALYRAWTVLSNHPYHRA